MYQLEVQNVCEAFPAGVRYLYKVGRWEDTRAGRALVAPHPVATIYHNPRERVLFSSVRDANPFFHLCEAIQMLAGRRDAAFLNNFVSDFGKRFAEPDGNIHDGYGYRWRHHFGFDQLDAVVKQLTNSPGSRQAVVQMWDPGDADDLLGVWATRPCNTNLYLRVLDEALHLTVCCRSNDIIFGAYGANSCHFSILQEYLAARLDLGVGTYVQFSNNYHAYEVQLEKLSGDILDNRYATTDITPSPLVHDAESFDEEMQMLLHYYENVPSEDFKYVVEDFNNKFLSTTVWPMLLAHHHYRRKNYGEALRWGGIVEALDWRIAACEWMKRRIK
jgi:thymidylate synthase